MATNRSNGIRLQDVIYVLRGVSSNDVGHPMVWDYLTHNWNNIYTL